MGARFPSDLFVFFWVNEGIGHCWSGFISGNRYCCRIGIDMAPEEDHKKSLCFIFILLELCILSILISLNERMNERRFFRDQVESISFNILRLCK